VETTLTLISNRIFCRLPGRRPGVLPREEHYPPRHQTWEFSCRWLRLRPYNRFWYCSCLETRECARYIRHTRLHGARGDVPTKSYDSGWLFRSWSNGLRMHVREETLRWEITKRNPRSHHLKTNSDKKTWSTPWMVFAGGWFHKQDDPEEAVKQTGKRRSRRS